MVLVQPFGSLPWRLTLLAVLVGLHRCRWAEVAWLLLPLLPMLPYALGAILRSPASLTSFCHQRSMSSNLRMPLFRLPPGLRSGTSRSVALVG